MVVDYRELNKVTVRKFFLIPNSDYIKSTVAGNLFISVGDLKEGFNQVDNEPETRKKMAVLSAGGCWLPRGLTFGPTNGPEDFQELVFIVFQRWLYKDWYLFVDDLSVATGRPKCHPEGPSGAHDVSMSLQGLQRGAMTAMERISQGLAIGSSAFPSPFAHISRISKYFSISPVKSDVEDISSKCPGSHPFEESRSEYGRCSDRSRGEVSRGESRRLVGVGVLEGWLAGWQALGTHSCLRSRAGSLRVRIFLWFCVSYHIVAALGLDQGRIQDDRPTVPSLALQEAGRREDLSLIHI